jgi:hypothetical protein
MRHFSLLPRQPTTNSQKPNTPPAPPTQHCRPAARRFTQFSSPLAVTTSVGYQCKLTDGGGNLSGNSNLHNWRACSSPALYSNTPHSFLVRGAGAGSACQGAKRARFAADALLSKLQSPLSRAKRVACPEP